MKSQFVKVCFELICICIASFVIYDQFVKYLKNEDSSSFTIKSFSEEAVNKYPEISICFSVAEAINLNTFNKSFLDYAKWNKESFLHLTQRGLSIDVINDSSQAPHF